MPLEWQLQRLGFDYCYDKRLYDLLHLPNGESQRLKVRSMVGLLPLCAATVFEEGTAARFPRLTVHAR